MLKKEGCKQWHCVCDCGTQKIVASYDLRSGKIVSCGCFKDENTKKRFTKHGLAHKSPEYNAWRGMLSRGSNKKRQDAQYYVNRGIVVCERWKTSFEAFLQDVGTRPSDKHSLDRIDNSKGYEPGNVRWATRKEQMRNTRRSRMLEWAGMTLSLAEWCERAGMSQSVVEARLNRYGWPWPQALYIPKGKRLA